MNLELANNRHRSSKLLMDHESKNSHHRGTSIVQLNCTFRELGFLIKGVPSEVKGSVTEITNEFTLTSDILHDCKLKESNKGEDLKSSSNRDLEGASPALSDIRELGSIVGNVSRKTESSTSGDLSKEGKLADTSVLQLNITKAVETLLVSTIQQTKGIEESKRGLGTELVLEGGEGSGGLASLGGGEGSSRGDEGGDDGRLHVDYAAFAERLVRCCTTKW
eukprot:CCRYP_015289-RC/>CCRYP_015289-RC protein AED:0.24 eAED:0.24 QI:17/-1/0/1/-1/0/1/0/220